MPQKKGDPGLPLELDRLQRAVYPSRKVFHSGPTVLKLAGMWVESGGFADCGSDMITPWIHIVLVATLPVFVTPSYQPVTSQILLAQLLCIQAFANPRYGTLPIGQFAGSPQCPKCGVATMRSASTQAPVPVRRFASGVALELMQKIISVRLAANAITFNASISACESL